MVEHPAAYPWSSYQGNAGDTNITLLTPYAVYLALGNTKAEIKSAYECFFTRIYPRIQFKPFALPQIRHGD
jgi:putative transposase